MSFATYKNTWLRAAEKPTPKLEIGENFLLLGEFFTPLVAVGGPMIFLWNFPSDGMLQANRSRNVPDAQPATWNAS